MDSVTRLNILILLAHATRGVQSLLIRLALLFELLSFRHGLFVRMDKKNKITWCYKGKPKFEHRLKLKERLNKSCGVCQGRHKNVLHGPKYYRPTKMWRFGQNRENKCVYVGCGPKSWKLVRCDYFVFCPTWFGYDFKAVE